MRFWTTEWSDCENNRPSWDECVEYRIKPEPKPDYSKFMGLYKNNECYGVDGAWRKTDQVSSEHTQFGNFKLCNKLELIFDGETKELKDVKIHGKE